MYAAAQIGGYRLRKILMLTLGWVLTVIGIVLTPAPIPIPLAGLLPLAAGLALLINYSRTMRRIVQRIRHRVRWLSYMIEHMAHRAPKKIGQILHRSRPHAIERKERIMTRPPEGEMEQIESKR
jgi:hypothetical protein